jgi:RNA polymerase sigma-70 factor (ECF subfamily)
LQQEETERQFKKLIQENERLIWKVCNIYAYTRADREDLFQDIVVRIWIALPTFRAESKVSTWIYRVAINTAITGLRKKKDLIHSIEPASLPTDAIDEDTRAEQEQLQELYTAIESLNSIEKAIVMLYLEERSYIEMEEILGIAQGTLRVKMNRIKEKLRQLTENK